MSLLIGTNPRPIKAILHPKWSLFSAQSHAHSIIDVHARPWQHPYDGAEPDTNYLLHAILLASIDHLVYDSRNIY